MIYICGGKGTSYNFDVYLFKSRSLSTEEKKEGKREGEKGSKLMFKKLTETLSNYWSLFVTAWLET